MPINVAAILATLSFLILVVYVNIIGYREERQAMRDASFNKHADQALALARR